MLVSLLLPHHGKLKEMIEEVLDVELIKQQIDTGVLEFEKYAGYIIGRTLCPRCLFLFDYRYRHGTYSSVAEETLLLISSFADPRPVKIDWLRRNLIN